MDDTEILVALQAREDRYLRLGPLPKSFPIEDIKPTLEIYRKDKFKISIPYMESLHASTTMASLGKAGLFSASRVVFLVHGFQCDVKTAWMHDMKDEMLSVADDIVVIVGWGHGADLLLIQYMTAASNTQVVGEWLGKIAAAISPYAKGIWGIGHSLGAHTVGKAGRTSNGAFYRITGLDPAGPGFERSNVDSMLHKDDANFVDVIHTDGYWSHTTIDPVSHYGSLSPQGDIDFYPNFGYEQPGCGGLLGPTSHHRAVELFIASVRNDGKFITYDTLVNKPDPCKKPNKDIQHTDQFAKMGYYADTAPAKRGHFYLKTSDSAPW